MKRKHVMIHIIMLNKHFNDFIVLTNYLFVMSSAFNTVLFVKGFKAAIYTPKTDIRWARND